MCSDPARHDASTAGDRWAGAGLRVEVSGAVARLILSRPERRNAMTPGTWRALAEVGGWLPTDVRVVVLTGEGPSFSAGIDLRLFSPDGIPGEPPLLDPAGSDREVAAAIESAQRGYTWLRRDDIVSIAAVQGHAIGAGFQLALACDLRVLTEDAALCMKEPALGLVPDLTGTKPLVDAVGVSRAIELCLTARTVAAAEARELGLATVVVPSGELTAAVDDLAAALLAVDRDTATATKALLRGAPGRTLDEQRAAEASAQVGRLRALLPGTGPA